MANSSSKRGSGSSGSNPLEFDQTELGDVSDISPMRARIVSPDELPELRGALVVLVDTRLAPVVSAALAGGSPTARVFRDGAGIAEALSEDPSLSTEDLIGVNATRHQEFAMGAVHGEPRSLPGGGGNAALEGVFSSDTRAGPERRLAAVRAQLGAGSDPEAASAAAAQQQQSRRAREVEAAMERFWRDTSFRSFERDVDAKPLLFAAGETLFSSVASCAGAKRLLLCSAINLGAVRTAALHWWADAAAPIITKGRGFKSLNSEVVIVSAGDQLVGDADDMSSCDLISAVLLYQLTQVGEVEIAEDDLRTRTLLRAVVQATAPVADAGAGSTVWDSASDDSAGWPTLRENMAQALQAEQQARGERAHPREVDALLDFDRLARGSTVPMLARATGGESGNAGSGGAVHSFEALVKGSGANYSQWSVGNRHS